MRATPVAVAVFGALLVAPLLPAPMAAAQVEDGPTTTTEGPPVDDPGADGDARVPPPLEPDEIPDAPTENRSAADDTDHELIVGTAELAAEQLARLERDLALARKQVEDLQARIALFDQFERDLGVARTAVVTALDSARARRLDRAVGAYVRGGPPGLDVSLATGPDTEAEESELLSSVLEADDEEVTRLLVERLDLTARLSRVAEARASATGQLEWARRSVADADAAVASGEYAARIFAAGSEVAITGFVFPVGGPHDFIDSWGFPRAEGRSHQGVDIFAERGTPLLAVEDGVLARVGDDRLGGIKLWLVGESGTHYYYAHLDEYALGVADGVAVDAGDVVGYVGDTGDARGTPPHLHFQLHPRGGDPVNPFALLSVVDELEAARLDR